MRYKIITNLNSIRDPIRHSVQRHYDAEEFEIEVTQQSGGDIHQSFAIRLLFESNLQTSCLPKRLFAKINSGLGAQVLKSEFESLQIINSTCPNLYPQAILYDQYDDTGLLLMSFHQLTTISSQTAAEAGRALAIQHKISSQDFGWASDNYIGLTPQPNQRNMNWVTFYQKQRLSPMIQLAANQGLPSMSVDMVEEIINKLDKLLCHDVVPSLVHGDLWSGNLGYDQAQQHPLFYDPAPYYGDREVDLAMTELFGRQPDTFYQAYQKEWPLSPGYQQRRPIYNLYHCLNHAVLFGSSYHQMVGNCLDQVPS
ncbi:MAG: fructosamine kinase family protein [Acidiferrobacterales bacterium]|nr:fructosamine kinase family protein [Acidiferrobacterales bacterium]